VLYSDEVDVHLNPKIGRDWMLPGQQRRVVTPGKNEKFYLAGALDVRTGTLHTTGTAKKNALLFCELLSLGAATRRRQGHARWCPPQLKARRTDHRATAERAIREAFPPP
jgi:hypothetical protein